MSTVKVDTIQTTGGASEIAIDKLKGVSSASSISVVGEGGTTTTNLQQGLAKHWGRTPADGASIHDSFNQASLTDHATGQQDFNLTNGFSGTNNYSACPEGGESVNDNVVCAHASSSSIRVYAYDVGSSAYVDNDLNNSAFGDLA